MNFSNFDNSHNSFLWPEYFIDFFMWKMDPMSGFDIRLVLILPPSDSTLQYKRCAHLWNNFPCIKSLNGIKFKKCKTAILLYMFVCLYPINVKTAEPIGPELCEGLWMIKISKIYLQQNLIIIKFRKSTKIFFKIREFLKIFLHRIQRKILQLKQ